jgi:3-methyladenine DNA glycosylase AlkD
MIERLIASLRAHANPANVAGMARYGISTAGTLGVPVYVLRRMAKEAGRDHALAEQLWSSGIHEARILATLVDDPALVTARQMDRWARDFDSWDVCDQACQNLFRYYADGLCEGRAVGAREARVRAARGIFADGGPGGKARTRRTSSSRFPAADCRSCGDDRNMVKKAVNWALRQIGKRNRRLHKMAIAAAEEIRQQDSRPARWIAADALRELRNPATVGRIKN